MTETCALSTATGPEENESGNVGQPSLTCEVMLQDVPDMDQLSTDKPNPRGEICMRGPGIMKGYFRNPEATAETIDKRGWLHSGDIGMILPGGKVRIIDRKKNFFKLAQGEYIAPEKIEAFIEISPWINQVVIEGNSLKNTPVALVYPDYLQFKSTGKFTDKVEDIKAYQNDVNEMARAFTEMSKQADVIKFIEEEANKICKDNKLKQYETPAAIFLMAEEMTPENGQLTPTFKKMRHAIKKRYASELDALFTKVQ